MYLIMPGIFIFCIWMFIDCIIHDVRDKVFWAILILGTGPIGATLYAIKRDKLLGENFRVTTTPEGRITVPIDAPASTSSQIIRGLGVTIGVVLSLGGLLIVGFFIMIMASFSSGSSSSSK